MNKLVFQDPANSYSGSRDQIVMKKRLRHDQVIQLLKRHRFLDNILSVSLRSDKNQRRRKTFRVAKKTLQYKEGETRKGVQIRLVSWRELQVQ